LLVKIAVGVNVVTVGGGGEEGVKWDQRKVRCTHGRERRLKKAKLDMGSNEGTNAGESSAREESVEKKHSGKTAQGQRPGRGRLINW